MVVDACALVLIGSMGNVYGEFSLGLATWRVAPVQFGGGSSLAIGKTGGLWSKSIVDSIFTTFEDPAPSSSFRFRFGFLVSFLFFFSRVAFAFSSC